MRSRRRSRVMFRRQKGEFLCGHPLSFNPFTQIKMNPTATRYIALALFIVAVLHTFSTKYFEHRARRSVHHKGSGIFSAKSRLSSGFGPGALCHDWHGRGIRSAITYIDSRDFTEPLFVFAIMAVAATRPILELTSGIILRIGSVPDVKNDARDVPCDAVFHSYAGVADYRAGGNDPWLRSLLDNTYLPRAYRVGSCIHLPCYS